MKMKDGNIKSCDFTYCSDKNKVFENYCNYMFTRTQSMFVYEGLPETIPVQWLEQYFLSTRTLQPRYHTTRKLFKFGMFLKISFTIIC